MYSTIVLYSILVKASMRRAGIWHQGNIARWLDLGDMISQ